MFSCIIFFPTNPFSAASPFCLLPLDFTSSINLNLYYFTKITDWLNWRDVVNANIIDIKKIVEDEGAAFAFPSRTVYVENATATDIG